MTQNPLQAYCRWLASRRGAPLASVFPPALPPAEDAARAAAGYQVTTPGERRAVVAAALAGRVPAFVAAQVAVVAGRDPAEIADWLRSDGRESPFERRPELTGALVRSKARSAMARPDVLAQWCAAAQHLWQVDICLNLGVPGEGLLRAAVFASPEEALADRVQAARRVLAAGASVRHDETLVHALLVDPIRHTPLGPVLLQALVDEVLRAGLPADARLSPWMPRSTLLEIAVDIQDFSTARRLVKAGADPWRRTMRDPDPDAQTLLGFALLMRPDLDASTEAELVALGGVRAQELAVRRRRGAPRTGAPRGVEMAR